MTENPRDSLRIDVFCALIEQSVRDYMFGPKAL